MPSPTEQFKDLARLIEHWENSQYCLTFIIEEMRIRSPIFDKEFGKVKKDRADEEARKLIALEKAKPILMDLPASTSAHDRLVFTERVLRLSTEALVLRRNAQNLYRHKEIPERDRLEAACQIVSAEMVRRRRADPLAVSKVERQVAGG